MASMSSERSSSTSLITLPSSDFRRDLSRQPGMLIRGPYFMVSSTCRSSPERSSSALEPLNR